MKSLEKLEIEKLDISKQEYQLIKRQSINKTLLEK